MPLELLGSDGELYEHRRLHFRMLSCDLDILLFPFLWHARHLFPPGQKNPQGIDQILSSGQRGRTSR